MIFTCADALMALRGRKCDSSKVDSDRFELHFILRCPVQGSTSIYSASDAGVDDAI